MEQLKNIKTGKDVLNYFKSSHDLESFDIMNLNFETIPGYDSYKDLEVHSIWITSNNELKAIVNTDETFY